MSNHIKPADRHPVAGQAVTLESTQVTLVPTSNTVQAPAKHPGKVNYLGKKKPSKAPPVNAVTVRRIERKVVSKGKYFGSGEQVYAFVMLDEDTAPKGEAANDPRLG